MRFTTATALGALIVASPAVAGYWQAPQPPIGSGNTIQCGDGFSCARAAQDAFYDDFTPGPCYHTYSLEGQLAGAVCLGYSNLDGAGRSGHASLFCDAGEFSLAAGCSATVPPVAEPDCSTQVGNPVDAASGMKVETASDFTTGGAIPLKFERRYVSQTSYWRNNNDTIGTRLGRGWRSNFDSTAFLVGSGSGTLFYVSVVLPTGQEIVFERTPGTSHDFQQIQYNSSTENWQFKNDGLWAKLIRNPIEQRLELRTADDTIRYYDYNGRMTAVAYRGGYTQTLTYNGAGFNSQITDNLGRSLSFTYSPQGLLSSMTAPDGTVYQYTYLARYNPADFNTVDPNEIGRPFWALETVTYPDGNANPGDNPDVRYHYEDTDHPFALTGITDERGIRYATWTYRNDGRVESSEHEGGADRVELHYNDANRRVTATNPLGKDTVYHFEDDGHGRNRLIRLEGKASANCAASDSTRDYDGNGYVSETTDAEARVRQITNDLRGRPTEIVEAPGTALQRTTSITWDSTYSLPTLIEQEGADTSLTIDPAGRVTGIAQTDTTTHTVPYSTTGQIRNWAFTYDTVGNLLTADGPLPGTGDTVTYTYDSNGYIASVTNAVGQTTTVDAVNGRGQPTEITDANGTNHELAYDERGRLTGITVAPGVGETVTELTYDEAGLITRITLPDGSWLRFTYDHARRLTILANNDGERIVYGRDDMGNATSVTVRRGNNIAAQRTQAFDELGRLMNAVGALGQTWTFGYDRTDNLVSQIDPRSEVYDSAYDALNRLLSDTDPAGGTITLNQDAKDQVTAYQDPRSLTTTYVRNGFGDVIRRSSPDAGTTDYWYDERGLLTKMVDARGVTTTFTYDDAGRRATKKFPGFAAENVDYFYDATGGGNAGVGRLTQMRDEPGRSDFRYDVRGNLIEEERTAGGIVYQVAYTYDAADRIATITYPSGRIVTFARDAFGRVSGVTTKANASAPVQTLASDVQWQPMGFGAEPGSGALPVPDDLAGTASLGGTIGIPEVSALRGNDALGGALVLKLLTYGNGLELIRRFTLDNELDRLLVRDASTDPDTRLIDRHYSRSDNLNLTGISDSVDPANDQSFTYSPANRLSGSSGPWGTLSWTYDLVGNRTGETIVSGGTTVRNFAYPATSNRLSSISGTPARSFTHDAAGNIVAETRAGVAHAFTHNRNGRLSAFSIGGTARATYVYDGFERLASRALVNGTPSGTTHFVHDSFGRVIAEANAAGAIQREYVWIEDMPLAVIADVATSPKIWFVHADHLGRPIRMTDATKAVVWAAEFRPFGEPHSITGSASLDMRFPGQWFQIESGLAYNWHRHYDPSTGRNLQPDPLGLVDGPSVWGYVGGNPVANVDPTGLQSVSPWPGARPPVPLPPPIAIPGTPEFERFGRSLGRAWAGIKEFAGDCISLFRSRGGGSSDDDDNDCDKNSDRETNLCYRLSIKLNHLRGCLARTQVRRAWCYANGRWPSARGEDGVPDQWNPAPHGWDIK